MYISSRFFGVSVFFLSMMAASLPAQSEIVIGAVLSETGPGASLGIPYKNALAIQDMKIGNEKVRIIFLNDNSDPTEAVKDVRKLVSDQKVDAIIGPTNTPQSLAVAQFANELKTPIFALAPIEIPENRKEWVYVVPQTVGLMIDGVVQDMQKRGVKTAAYIGFADAWGELVWKSFKNSADKAGIRLVANERYARTDTSVTAQIARIIAAKPDAVLGGGSGTPGALPHIELGQRGYKGLEYDNHGSVNQDYLRVGGKYVEGVIAPTGPLVVDKQLPANYPLKQTGADFMRRYEARYGVGTANPFAGYSNDAFLLIKVAATHALKSAKPGTLKFRMALKDNLDKITKLDGTEATYTITPSNHYGAQDNARVMVQVVNGKWSLISE